MKCGQTYALIGANGSGKSTLATLICRLFTPSKGAILWNGVPTNSYARLRLRNRIAYVPQVAFGNSCGTYACQVPYLFAGSVEENIRIGNPDASDAQGTSHKVLSSDLLIFSVQLCPLQLQRA